MRQLYVAVSSLFLSLWLNLAWADPPKLTIISSASPYVKKVFDAITLEAFKRLDVEVELIRIVETERALRQANDGNADGDGLRVANIITQLYPNLYMVPESYVEIKYAGFSKDGDIRTDGWDSLEKYDVGFQIGWKILEKNLWKARSITKVEDGESLFRMLEHNRIDAGIYVDIGAIGIMRKLDIVNIKMLEPPLATRDMYLYLHKKHEDFIPKVAKTLRAMKEDGTHQYLLDKVMAEFSNQ